MYANALLKASCESIGQRAFGEHLHLVNASLNAFLTIVDWIM